MNEANTMADILGTGTDALERAIAKPETIDQAHERLGHKAPRVTPADLEANIVAVEYVTHRSSSGQTLRWAVLVLRNGFALAGEPSASVSPKNDSEELGRRFALENAKRALWPLMGYALRERLYQGALRNQHAEPWLLQLRAEIDLENGDDRSGVEKFVRPTDPPNPPDPVPPQPGGE